MSKSSICDDVLWLPTFFHIHHLPFESVDIVVLVTIARYFGVYCFFPPWSLLEVTQRSRSLRKLFNRGILVLGQSKAGSLVN